MKIKYIYILIVFMIVGCQNKTIKDAQFELLKKGETGLNFDNTAIGTVNFNAMKYMYFFNGGGVASGDFNNDGLEDLFFTSNLGKNKLYLNKGDIKFKDATKAAGMEGQDGWTSGVTVVDINNDGMLDLYVSQVGDFKHLKGKNQLYVCQKIENNIPIYEDKAADYGLDFVVFGTQATFFDYDLDGDLDMFQINHSVHNNGTFGQKSEFEGTQDSLSGDKLMRNDNGKFVDVTIESGIKSLVIGYGLGVVTGDVNQDGYPDIYVGNDFHEDDYLYINQGDGTFKDMRREAMMHTSRFSMGVDIADLNNDGWSEIISLDMLPFDPDVLKRSLGEDDFKAFKFKLGYGYQHQYARNNLQYNNGNGTFSEIGMFSDVHATDWSWSSLLLDFDHDGLKDIFISNGIPRRMNDIDFINFRTSDPDVMWETNHLDIDKNLKIIETMPRIKLNNKFYRNKGKLGFEDLKDKIQGDLPTFSNGAVYADLDNDGDLDVVVNNIEDEPFVYKNLTIERQEKNEAEGAKLAKNHYLHLDFKGSPKNINAIGARVIVFKGTERLIYEHFPTRGFQSSVQLGLNIGVGSAEMVDSVLVIWSDHSYQKLTNIQYNQKMTITWTANLPKFDFKKLQQKPAPLVTFEDWTAALGIDFLHDENPFLEFDREQLIPHAASREGPALAVGDANGDGLEDFFIGNAKRRRAALFLQQPNGRFYEKTPDIIRNDSLKEETDAIWVDFDNDGDLDLAIATGGNEYMGKSEQLEQYIYVNDGKGNFGKYVFPDVHLTASCILPADVNGDGLTDFFIGGRVVQWKYGYVPDSYLFINKGNGQFENATDQLAPALKKVGLVKGGNWADLDSDGDMDLVLAMEWDAIQIFKNNKGKLEKMPLNDLSGWWNFAFPYDFDGDGDIDILAGNLGSNAKFKPTNGQPVRLYVNDFDKNKQVESVLTYYLDDREIPFANYAELTKQLPALKKRFIYSKDFAKASITEIFGTKSIENSLKYEVNHFKSMYFENTGNWTFEPHTLPDQLQWSTLQTAFIHDGKALLGGNYYDCNIEMGRYDANYGSLLSIGKNGKMTASNLGNVQIKGQIKNIAAINIKGKTYYILAKNEDKLQIIKANEK